MAMPIIKTRMPTVDVKGHTVNRPEDLEPVCVKDHDQEEWFEIEWSETTALKKAPSYFRPDLFDQEAYFGQSFGGMIDSVFDSLAYSKQVSILPIPTTLWSRLAKDLPYASYEYTIAEALCDGMHNAAGRMAIYLLFRGAFHPDKNVNVINVGGSSSKNRQSKCLHFFVLPQATSPKRARLEVLEGPTEKVKNPDVVVEALVKGHIKELLIISIKSGSRLSESADRQIKLEMLPACIKYGKAVGLVICAMRAHLYFLEKNNSMIDISRRSYSFISKSGEKDVSAFKDLCRDTIFYTMQMLQA